MIIKQKHCYQLLITNKKFKKYIVINLCRIYSDKNKIKIKIDSSNKLKTSR